MLPYRYLAILILLPVLPLTCSRVSDLPKTNIVLISIDTLRADHLSGYGYPRQTTPNLDRLAREGTVFTRAFSSSSWTVPSHMTMLTSLPALLHGVDNLGKSLDSERVTLAECLKAAGYKTAAFVSGPTLHRAFGFSQGFDLYENLSGIAKVHYGENPLRNSLAWSIAHETVTGPRVGKRVKQWLAAKAEIPFFLFVHLWDPHYDYIPPPPYDELFDPNYQGTFDFSRFESSARINSKMPEREKYHLVALYDGEIAATDALIGDLISALEQEGFKDNTMIIVTSDHGEEFFEHGGKGHFKTLYEEVLHVPLIFHFPGRVKAAQKIHAIFGAIHLMPTILGMVGVPLGTEAKGDDLSGILRGEHPPEGLESFSSLALMTPLPIYSVRTDDRKYIFRQVKKDPIELSAVFFDLKRDPGEKQPISQLDPEARRLFHSYLELIKSYERTARDLPKAGISEDTIDEKTREQLRSLGYIQ